VRSVASCSLHQLTKLATQLVTTVQNRLKCTRDEAEQRARRVLSDIAEREHRLLLDAAERDRRAHDEHVDREHALLKDAQSVRDALLAHGQHTREIEVERERRLLDDAEQRERDLRRDMYDLAAERARAAALETELQCLKATAGPATVAYEVVGVQVQSYDISPPAVDVDAAAPIDNLVVQNLAADMTQQLPSMPAPIVYRHDIAHAPPPHAVDTHTVYSSALLRQPPHTSSSMHESVIYQSDPAYSHIHSSMQTGPSPAAGAGVTSLPPRSSALQPLPTLSMHYYYYYYYYYYKC